MRSLVLVISPSVSFIIKDEGCSILSSREMRNRSLLATDKALEMPGNIRLLFASPEEMIGATKRREKLINYPLSKRIIALGADEVHCISKWYEWILQ